MQKSLQQITNEQVLDNLEFAAECAELDLCEEIECLRKAADVARQTVDITKRMGAGSIHMKDGRGMLDVLDAEMQGLYAEALRNAALREMLPGFGINVTDIVKYHRITETCAGCGNYFDWCTCGESFDVAKLEANYARERAAWGL